MNGSLVAYDVGSGEEESDEEETQTTPPSSGEMIEAMRLF